MGPTFLVEDFISDRVQELNKLAGVDFHPLETCKERTRWLKAFF